MDAKKLYVSVDIEKAGESYDHALLAVAICIGTLESGIISTKTWYMSTKGQQVCLQSICDDWAPTRLDLLDTIAKEGKPLEEQMFSIYDYMNEVATKAKGYDMVLLSDNPSVVFGHLDYHFRLAQVGKGECLYPFGKTLDNRSPASVNPVDRKRCLGIHDEVSTLLYLVDAPTLPRTPSGHAITLFWMLAITESAIRIRDRKRDYREKLEAGLKFLEEERSKGPLDYALIYRALDLRG